ncbi:hypothetical protein EV144_106257 [Flavobacterium sp. 270]|uniref:hypothetical protein n=1 Tax=Flavobacterium sp. 270 TaxID=2512114 RepID=UPI00106703F0|nr:hypothetical protein [Flavobacterium sp. 270]TDW46585.1 hypothetical protein EV144_106257 [Flavobacterium sp. 270]
MAIQTLKIIKNWFRSGLKPTQSQFWDTWDSFRHKSEKVSVAEIEGIIPLLDNKADKSSFENHLTDPAAHPQLLISAKYIHTGEFTVWKHPTNKNPANKFVLEVNDYVMGWVDINWISGFYTGGNIDQIESFSVNTIL